MALLHKLHPQGQHGPESLLEHCKEKLLDKMAHGVVLSTGQQGTSPWGIWGLETGGPRVTNLLTKAVGKEQESIRKHLKIIQGKKRWERAPGAFGGSKLVNLG